MWTHGHKQQAAGGTSQPRLAGAVEAGKPLVIQIDTSGCREADEAAICQQLQRIDMSEAKVLMLHMRNLPPQLHSGSPFGLHCGQLCYLDLSRNNLARLPPWVPQQQHLRLLNLSNCGQLEMLPQEFGQLTSLVKLNLSGCQKLASLPESIGCLQALQVLDMGNSGVTELPASFGNLSRLHTLFAPCLLATLPDSCGQLRSLQTLRIIENISFKALPTSFGQLAALEQLDLHQCFELTELPDSFGELQSLQVLNLRGCRALSSLPPSMVKLTALIQLNLQGCTALAQPLPDSKWRPKRQIAYVLDTPAIIQLATQQETMLTTLERMSWLVVLLATATFIAFMQPPGGLDDDSKQVLVSNSTMCASNEKMGSDQASVRACALLVFFVLDGLSFGFSIGCVMMIIVMSMPRRQFDNERQEAGRFWLLLLLTWVLLYVKVLTGFGAFIASGLAVHNMAAVVVGPVVPGMILLVAGIVAIVLRFWSLHPGWHAVWLAISCSGRKKSMKPTNPDVELGQDIFWTHCKQVLQATPDQQRQPAWPVTVTGCSEELQQLLGGSQDGAGNGNSGGSASQEQQQEQQQQ